MRILNFIYYSIYRFVLKTPTPEYAKAWAVVFAPYTVWSHALGAYFLVTHYTGAPMAPAAHAKAIGIVVMASTMLLSFRYYITSGTGERVIGRYAKRGSDTKYALIGAIMLIETTLLPLALVFGVFWLERLRG
jgi:hypothetical protein